MQLEGQETYPLQIPMRDVERMKVFQPLGNIEQLPQIGKIESVTP